MPGMCGRGLLVRVVALCVALLVGPTACGTSKAPRTGYDVEWIEGGDAAPATRESMERRLSQPWPDEEAVRGEAAGEEQPPVMLGSCRDYLDVADQQVRPVEGGGGGLAFSIFQARVLSCEAMALTLAAQPAVVSHLRGLVFDETLPDQLPWEVAMIISSAEAGRIATGRPQATWREALFEPLTGFSSCGTYCGHYSDPGSEQAVSLVARGDFDGDGIEDVLLGSYDAATGGSYRTTRMLLLTRREPGGRVELVRELEY